MDPISRVVAAGAAGAGAAGAALYVDDVFSTYLYDGTSAAQTITNGIDLSGEGGLTWIKCRTISDLHYWYDTERGATKSLHSDFTYSEQTRTNTLTSFNSDGFSLGTDADTNFSGRDYASWTFRKAPGFFDVVTYTGDGSSNRAISHSLGSTPGFVIVKRTSSAEDWACWHNSFSAGERILLNTTAAKGTASGFPAVPTSTTFSVGGTITTNGNGDSYVAYLFAHDDQSFGTNGDEAIIKCGSYTATGSAQTINLGFEPQFLITKKSSGVGEWRVNDAMRGIVSGGADAQLDANSGAAELTGNVTCDLTATGFITNGSQNDSGATYIYIAIRRPHKPPEVGTDVFDVNVETESRTTSGWTSLSGFVTDAFMNSRNLSSEKYTRLSARLTGGRFMYPDSTSAEGTTLYFGYDTSDGIKEGTSTLVSSSDKNIDYHFRRAPGFFDVVTYTGTGSDLTLNHNLGAVPELIICRNRSSGTGRWYVYPGPLSSSEQKHLRLNETIAVSSSASLDWAPTATTFNADTFLSLSTSGTTYIAYLFATLDGISKVGSYSGTGSNVDVDCGFTAGARFVLIKRTDSTGDWYVWDSTRGIVSGDDPYILLNSTAAEVTNTDYIDPLNAGFTVTSSAPAALNTSGGTYLFLAIA